MPLTEPYSGNKPPLPETIESLRARIPGWGADLDPADRPSYPRETTDARLDGARWELPEQQPHEGYRERSIEHADLTPVFGTAQPLRGLSGAIRRRSYERYSEGQAAHWLLLWAMWAAMMAAMMLPSSTPFVLLYSAALRNRDESVKAEEIDPHERGPFGRIRCLCIQSPATSK